MATDISPVSSAFNILFSNKNQSTQKKIKIQLTKQLLNFKIGKLFQNLMHTAFTHFSYEQIKDPLIKEETIQKITDLVHRVFVELIIDTYKEIMDISPEEKKEIDPEIIKELSFAHTWEQNLLMTISLPIIRIFFLLQEQQPDDNETYRLQRWAEIPKFIYSYICRNPMKSQDEVSQDIQTEITIIYSKFYAIKAPIVQDIALSIIKTIYALKASARIPPTQSL